VNVDTTNANSGILDVHGSGTVYGTDHMWLSVSFRCLGSGSSSVSISDESWMDDNGFTLSFDPILDGTVSQTGGSSPPSGPKYVGGELFTANKLALLSPYLAFTALIGIISAGLVKRRRTC